MKQTLIRAVVAPRMSIPQEGVPKDELYEELVAIAKGDVNKV
jgi:hypothetical protein